MCNYGNQCDTFKAKHPLVDFLCRNLVSLCVLLLGLVPLLESHFSAFFDRPEHCILIRILIFANDFIRILNLWSSHGKYCTLIESFKVHDCKASINYVLCLLLHHVLKWRGTMVLVDKLIFETFELCLDLYVGS